MPQIMAEAFAKGLVDKIMVEVLDVIDRDAHDGKPWERRADEETGDVQCSALAFERSQAREHTHVNYSKAEEMELIAKIVRDLHDMQIGDSRYVLPPSLLALEKQVKCTAACNVDGAPLANPTDVAETHTIQGQGDTHQIIHAAIHESSTEPTLPATAARKDKENETVTEATNVSVGLLHQLIEELQSETAAASSKDDFPSNSTSTECIAVWEEKEERLIRTIEGTGNVLGAATETIQSKSTGHFHDVEPKRDEPRARSSQRLASASREVRLEGIQIERGQSGSLPPSSKPPRDDVAMIAEEILSIDEMGMMSNEAIARKKKKKSSFGSRLRKFLRAAFGRRKN